MEELEIRFDLEKMLDANGYPWGLWIFSDMRIKHRVFYSDF
ncbi:hypothetical protein [Blautia sp. HCP3S3_C12]